MGAPLYVTFAAIVASVGGVLEGYDIGIASGALLQLKKEFNLTSFEQEMVITSVIIGAFFGSLFGGSVVDNWGRKLGLGVSCFFFIIGAIILSSSVNVYMLIVGQLVVGMAASLSITSAFTYISEVSPPNQRGMMVSFNEVFITVGFLLAYLVNYLFITVNNGWKYMFGAAAFLALIQALGIILVPKSHYFLLMKGDTEQARKVLRSLRDQKDVEEEIKSITASLKTQKENSRYIDLFSISNNMYQRMILGFTLVVLKQFSGNNNVLFYAPTVFQHFGYDSDSTATLVTVGLGVVKVLATIFALLIVDKVGRRTLLLVGCLLMATSIMTLGIVGTVTKVKMEPQNETAVIRPHYIPVLSDMQNSTNEASTYDYELKSGPIQGQKRTNININIALDVSEPNSNEENRNVTNGIAGKKNFSYANKITSIVSLMVFVCAYGVSYGPVTFVVLGEIFPVSLRGRAISVATVFNWGASILVSLTFLDVVKVFGIGPTFMMYGFVSYAAAIFVYMCIPETKNRSLEEIDELLRNRKWCRGATKKEQMGKMEITSTSHRSI